MEQSTGVLLDSDSTTTIAVDKLKDDIWDKLIDLSDDSCVCHAIFDKVHQIERSGINDQIKLIHLHKRQLHQYETAVKQHLEENDKLGKDLESQRSKLDLERKIMPNLIIVRQYLNKLFYDKWEEISKDKTSIINNVDFSELANITPQLKRKHLFDNNGIKIALCVLHNKCTGLPKDLCEFYITLNDKFHPKIKPDKIVRESIHALKDFLTGVTSECQSSPAISRYGINIKILNEIESFLKE